MLQIKSKYKIAKRLGAGVFDQTQTQKFALSAASSGTNKKRGRGPRGGSDFGKQLIEKQKVRMTYGLTERQFARYVHEAEGEKDSPTALYKRLEMRADMAVYRAGLAATKRAARQMVSHGHIVINGKRITTPSYLVKKGDVLTVREGSRKSPLFAGLSDEQNNRRVAAWLDTDFGLLKSEVKGEPGFNAEESGLALATVFEFYSR